MRDASLDEFLSGGDEGSEGSVDEADDASGEQSGPEPEPGTERGSDTDPGTEGPPTVEDVEPARSTFAWSTDGEACAECGERVEERWESEVGMVCVECKSW